MVRKPLSLRKKVFRSMGLGKGTLANSSRRDLQRHFYPNAARKYPSNRSGDASRVPIEYGARQWGHLDFLGKALKNPSLARQIARDPLARIEFEKALFDALQERALKGYAEEWSSLSPKAISALVGRSKKTGAKPTPTIANEFNASMVAREAMSRLKKGKEITIVDLGCGAGGTIVPIIESIPLAQRKHVRVVLVDVMQNGLRGTRQKLARRGLNGKEQVITVKENLASLTSNDKLAHLFGQADIVTSGAALHHVAAIEPTFEGVKRILKKGGSFIFWDWGHAAWKAPNLVVAPKGAIVDKYGREYEKGRKTVEAEKRTAFVSRGKIKAVSGNVPTELQSVREMLSTWISLLNFPKARQAEFLQWFDKKALRGEPISFSEYLKKLEGRKRDRGMPRAEIKYWEGHRPPELYHDAMRRVGLIGEQKPFNIYPTQSSLLYQTKVKKE